MRQAGSIVRKRKRYYIVYRTPAKQQRWEGGFDTKGKAQERLTEVLSSMHTGAYFKPTETTFKEFAEKWLENRVSLAGSTYEAYKILLGRHAMPLLGHLKLREIDSGVIQHLIAELCRKSSVNNPTKRLSANTVRKTSTLLGQVFQSAVKAKLIHTNPARNLDDLPKLGRPNIQFPEKEDVLEILKQAPAESRLFFLLDAMTGLRRGELLALQWRDIDWLQSEVAVERSISKQKGSDGAHKYQWAVGPTKTGQVRTVGIPSTALAALQALRTTSEQQQEEDFIFTRNGTFISPQHFTRSISSPLLKAALAVCTGCDTSLRVC